MKRGGEGWDFIGLPCATSSIETLDDVKVKECKVKISECFWGSRKFVALLIMKRHSLMVLSSRTPNRV